MPYYPPSSGAADSDATLTFTDITTNNSSTSKHGFLKKLDNTSTHFMDGTGAWSTPSGSGGLTHAYIGYNTIGGSSEAMVQWRVYTKAVTLASDGFLASIGIYIKNKGSAATNLRVGVYDNNSGAPKNLQAYGGVTPGTSGLYLEKTGGVDGDLRWFHIPIGIWLVAGTYYLGVQTGNVDSGSNSATTIAYDTSGSDQIWTSTIDDLTDGGSVFAITDSTKKYSIRGSVLT